MHSFESFPSFSLANVREDVTFYTLKRADLGDMGWMNQVAFWILNEPVDRSHDAADNAADGLSLRDSFRVAIENQANKLLDKIFDDVASNYPKMAFVVRAWKVRTNGKSLRTPNGSL